MKINIERGEDDAADLECQSFIVADFLCRCPEASPASLETNKQQLSSQSTFTVQQVQNKCKFANFQQRQKYWLVVYWEMQDEQNILFPDHLIKP